MKNSEFFTNFKNKTYIIFDEYDVVMTNLSETDSADVDLLIIMFIYQSAAVLSLPLQTFTLFKEVSLVAVAMTTESI